MNIVLMERGTEVTAILWSVLILCLAMLAYLIFVPEEEQQKAKAAADAYSAEITGRTKDEKKD